MFGTFGDQIRWGVRNLNQCRYASEVDNYFLFSFFLETDFYFSDDDIAESTEDAEFEELTFFLTFLIFLFCLGSEEDSDGDISEG